MHIDIYGTWAEARMEGNGRNCFTVDGIVSGALRGRQVYGYTTHGIAKTHPDFSRALNEIHATMMRGTAAPMQHDYLFIGGPEHGKRRTLRGEEWRQVVVAEPPSMFSTYAGSRTLYDEPTFKTTRYTREKVGQGGATGSRRMLEIMRHESLSPTTAAEAALDIIWTEAGGRVA